MSTSWNEGYTVETNYNFYNYYSQFNPLPFKFHFLNKSIAYPKIKTACELGFGQGLSLNMHAVSTEIKWYGNDFMPDQVAYAKKLAEKSGTNINIYDDSFAEFLKRDDLPNFDYIALHGIWTWINDENKKHIVDFIKRKLNVGGILYISYNTLPGHSKRSDLREFMYQYEQRCTSHNTSVTERVAQCLNFAENLYKLSPSLTAHNPLIFKTIETLRGQDFNYLHHEYLNESWDCMYFHEFAKFIEPAKLNYVASSSVDENMDMINYTKEQLEFFSSVSDPFLVETMKDCVDDRQFRTDIWVKGACLLTELEKEEAARDLTFVFIADRDKVKLEQKGNAASVDLTKILNPILDLIEDRKIHNLYEIFKKTKTLGFTFSDTMFAMQSLLSQSAIIITQEVSKDVKERTQKLNHFILDSCFKGSKINNLACPLNGGAIMIDLLHQLIFKTYNTLAPKKNVTAEKMLDYIDKTVSIQKLNFAKDGKAFTDEEQKRAVLLEEINRFLAKKDLYKTLGVID